MNIWGRDVIVDYAQTKSSPEKVNFVFCIRNMVDMTAGEIFNSEVIFIQQQNNIMKNDEILFMRHITLM